ncbi:hypothetical protein [Parabacteroides sp. AM08-6]|uniref:hypothetical protein n=1 Tax=Parabacteroides sp. AM08-6 TaxID=2292053 RepID=UPI000EFE2C21|nr:hypothetical protein [Parabacteroides sp. AM08-6]RHJ78395.1 hypothetical protein DW103_15005 [Parabacteroides sp. AM08-6]
MDNSRIHILLDKYWRCITTVEEERELRCFFSTQLIPPEFRPYQTWFQTSEAEELLPLSHEFDQKIMERIALEHRAKRRRWLFRLFMGLLISILVLFILFLTASFLSENMYL